MLTIENYTKIKNRWFGDWQIGKVMEDKTYYALQAFHKDKKQSITIVIFRTGTITENFEVTYNISLLNDSKSGSLVIEDIIYKSVLEDMELFGESLSHYLNTI